MSGTSLRGPQAATQQSRLRGQTSQLERYDRWIDSHKPAATKSGFGLPGLGIWTSGWGSLNKDANAEGDNPWGSSDKKYRKKGKKGKKRDDGFDFDFDAFKDPDFESKSNMRSVRQRAMGEYPKAAEGQRKDIHEDNTARPMFGGQAGNGFARRGGFKEEKTPEELFRQFFGGTFGGSSGMSAHGIGSGLIAAGDFQRSVTGMNDRISTSAYKFS